MFNPAPSFGRTSNARQASYLSMVKLADDARAMVLKRYYHIGFAVDTDQGLVVPVVRDADQLGVFELAAKIAELSARARDGKLIVARAYEGKGRPDSPRVVQTLYVQCARSYPS